MFGSKKDRDARRTAPVPPTATPPATTPASSRPSAREGSKGQLAYEARRAEKAGMGLEKWMAEKSRRMQEQRAAAERAQREAARPAAKPGLLRRLLDRAHKPL